MGNFVPNSSGHVIEYWHVMGNIKFKKLNVTEAKAINGNKPTVQKIKISLTCAHRHHSV